MNIEQWLRQFRESWINKDIQGILEIFSDGVEYWETPFKKLGGKAAVAEAWKAIESQNNVVLDLEIMKSVGEDHVVKWLLSYEDQGTQEWGGLYLITLDPAGKCEYFFQVGEKA